MKTLNYNLLNQSQQQQVEHLVADLEGKLLNSTPIVRFVARGEVVNGGEFVVNAPA